METTVAVAVIGFCSTVLAAAIAWAARPRVDRRNNKNNPGGMPVVCIYSNREWDARWETALGEYSAMNTNIDGVLAKLNEISTQLAVIQTQLAR